MRTGTAVVVLLLALLLMACGSSPATQNPVETVMAGRITFAGSTTVQPLADQLGQAFRELYPDVALDIAAGGSGVGIQAIHEGTVDIGMASRALKPEEAEGIQQHQVAVDVIAVVVPSASPIESLTLEQLGEIYRGTIVDWSEVGGPEQPIVVVARGQNSGTRGAFDELVLEKDEQLAAPSLLEAVTAGDMAAIVGSNPGAIGYVGFGNLEPTLKLVSIDGVLPSEASARDGSYVLTRPLLLLTGPLTQPLAQAFVDFALSAEGQQIVVESGWVPAR